MFEISPEEFHSSEDAQFTEETAIENTDPDALAGLLTLKAIAERIGINYSRLRGFADAPGVREAIGAVDVPGVKGMRYPVAASALLEALIDGQDRGEVEPKTAAGWLRRRAEEGRPVVIVEPGSGVGIATLPHSRNGTGENALTVAPALAVAELVAALRDAATATRESISLSREAAPLDTTYTLTGAARATGLSQRTIKANVPYILDGGRRKYLASDIKAFISGIKRHSPVANNSETTNETL